MAKKTPKQTPTLGFFEAMAQQGPFAGFGGEQTKQEPAKTGVGPTIAELQAQLREQNARLEAFQRERTLQSVALAAPTPQVRTQEDPKIGQVDLSGLPDPVADFEGYQKALSERISGAIQTGVKTGIERHSSALTAEQEAKQKVDALFTDFSKLNPEYGKNADRVAFAAEKAVREAQARGLDGQKYIFGARDQFFKDVQAHYDSVFGKPTAPQEEDEGDEGDDTGALSDRTLEQAATDGRAVAVFGGSPGGKGKGAAQQQEQKGDLLSDLKELQQKSGFF